MRTVYSVGVRPFVPFGEQSANDSGQSGHLIGKSPSAVERAAVKLAKCGRLKRIGLQKGATGMCQNEEIPNPMGGTLHGHSEIRIESEICNRQGGMNYQPENFDRRKLPLGESDVLPFP